MTAPSKLHEHDLLVLVGGAVLVAVGLLVRGAAGDGAAYTAFERDGLRVPYPQRATWFPPVGDGYPAVIGSAQCSSDPRAACADRPTARVEVRLYDDAMGLGQAQAGKDHDAEYGARARRLIAAEAPRTIRGKEWRCARFAYVPAGARSESVAIECTLSARKKLHVVTLAGPDAYVRTLEPAIIDQLAVKEGER